MVIWFSFIVALFAIAVKSGNPNLRGKENLFHELWLAHPQGERKDIRIRNGTVNDIAGEVRKLIPTEEVPGSVALI